MGGIKISQFTTITTALTSAYVTLVQAGVNVIITVENFLTNYYNKDEVDQIIENLVIGGSTIGKRTLENQSINAEQSKTFTHNLSTLDFTYSFLIWNDSLQKYIEAQFKLPENNRTTTTVSLYSSQAISNFKLIFIG